MNTGNFIVWTELEHVVRFADRAQWDGLDPTALVELRDHVAGLPSEQGPEHITAKLFRPDLPQPAEQDGPAYR